MKSVRKTLLSLVTAVSCTSTAFAAEPAMFDAATGQLHLPVLQVDAYLWFRNVVLQLNSLGRFQLGDVQVGTYDPAFFNNRKKLDLPQLLFNGVVYNKVSLTNASFAVLSFETSVKPGTPATPSTNTLDVRITVQGTAVPLITINNVQRPTNQNDFCNNSELQQTVLQNAGAYQASWTMTSCTFNGTMGRMDGLLTISDPVLATLPVVANFTFR